MRNPLLCCTIFTFVASAAQPTVAFAQPGTEPASAPESEVDVAWQRDYTTARKQLEQGAFREAEQKFQALAARARTAEDARLAREMAALSRSFGSRRLRLTPIAPAAEPVPLHGGERTSDELASLYLGSVGYGLGTGAWLAVLTEPNSVARAVLPALGIAGAAAAGVALADSADLLKYGVPQSITTGLMLGLGEGLVWALWNQSRVDSDDEWDDKTLATVIWSATTLGGVAGGVVGSVAGTTPGRASFVSSSGLWVGAISGLVAATFSGDEHDERDDNALLAGAIGLNAGAVGGAFLAGPLSPSVARTRFIDLGGIAGALVAGGVYVSATDGFDSNDDDGQVRGFFATTALGIGAGLGLATYFTRNMRPDRPPERARTSEARPRVSPTILPAPGGGAVGVAGIW